MKTIVALSSPPGRGGVAVIRLSGPESLNILAALTGGRPPKEPRKLSLKEIRGAEGVRDSCLCAFFSAPASFTGEDMAEIHCHGSAAVTGAIIKAAVNSGAVPAEAGEFTRRAFLNGKLDLSAAEGIIDLINSQAAAQARAAAAQTEGALFKRVSALEERLTALIAALEAAVDYPEEDIEELSAIEAARETEELLAGLTGLMSGYGGGRLVREGINAVIAGKPNAGKSSLLNALLKEERAIVSAESGTTRDTLTEAVEHKGYKINLTDTAGIREAEGAIEREGVNRAKKAVSYADVIIYLSESGEFTEDVIPRGAELSGVKLIKVISKCDLTVAAGAPVVPRDGEAIRVSAWSGEGLDLLLDRILAVTGAEAAQDALLLNARHYAAAAEAAESLKLFLRESAQRAEPECLITLLRAAHNALGQITGGSAGDKVLDAIFSKFCVGK